MYGRYSGGDFQDHSKRKRPQRFLSKVFVKKKGGYLLSHIALFDTVYHQCMDGMVAAIFHIAQNEQMKKRSLDCSNERFDKKKGGSLLSRVALLNTVYHRCIDGMVAAISHIAQNE